MAQDWAITCARDPAAFFMSMPFALAASRICVAAERIGGWPGVVAARPSTGPSWPIFFVAGYGAVSLVMAVAAASSPGWRCRASTGQDRRSYPQLTAESRSCRPHLDPCKEQIALVAGVRPETTTDNGVRGYCTGRNDRGTLTAGTATGEEPARHAGVPAERFISPAQFHAMLTRLGLPLISPASNAA